jgi:hypothetical protein
MITLLVGRFAPQMAATVARHAGTRVVLDIKNCDYLADESFTPTQPIVVFSTSTDFKRPMLRILQRKATHIVEARRINTALVVKGVDRGVTITVERESAAP